MAAEAGFEPEKRLKLKGKYSLLELHALQKAGRLHIWIDNETQKIDEIAVDVEDDRGIFYENVPVWRKNRHIVVETSKSYEKVPKYQKPKEQPKPIPVYTPSGQYYWIGDKIVKPKEFPSRMNDFRLIAHYNSFDPDDLKTSYAQFAVVHNEMVKRELIEAEKISLNEAVEIDIESKYIYEKIVEEIPF